MMTTRPVHGWAIVRQLPNLQNAVVNRFRRRSEAEDCLQILRRSQPSHRYTILYAPADQDLTLLLAGPPEDWAMASDDGNRAVAQMMRAMKAALTEMPLPSVRRLLRQQVALMGQRYGEIYDSGVREAIEVRLTRWACEVHELDPCAGLRRDFWEL